MNTINLIQGNYENSNTTLALSLVRAICCRKEIFNVQIACKDGQPQVLGFKIDYKARFKANMNRLLQEISEFTLAREVDSIQALEPEKSNSSERQVVRLMNSGSLDEFLAAESHFISQFQPCQFSDSKPAV